MVFGLLKNKFHQFLTDVSACGKIVAGYYDLVFYLQKIKALLHNDKITQTDMLRLVMLYALRYESHSNNDVSGLVETLRKKGVNDKHRTVSFYMIPIFLLMLF